MQVILNADDFGRSADINAAVLQAHRQGVLTSASLMVAGEAAGEAVALARQTPTLAVGLHVVVTNGRATLPQREIPHLVNCAGYFPDNLLQAGLRYHFSSIARQELARELAAQFERFAATGLPLAHVDGHQHMHLHPRVLDIVLSLAGQYGARGLRIPRDAVWLSLAYDRRHSGLKLVWAVTFGLLNRHSLRRLQGCGLVTARRVYGLMQSGCMEEAYVLQLLRRLNAPTAELYFHPSNTFRTEALGPNPDDLATLLSPAVRQVIQQRGIHLATYPTLTEK